MSLGTSREFWRVFFSFVSCTTRHERGLGRQETGPHVQQQASEQTGVEPVVDMRIILGPLGR
jgi:hypothetical protein